MTLAIVLIGFAPTYAAVGFAAPLTIVSKAGDGEYRFWSGSPSVAARHSMYHRNQQQAA
jgi:hypothetical protein